MQPQQKQTKKPRNPLAAMAAEIVTANENAPATEVAAKKPRTKADPAMQVKIGKIFNPRTNHVDKDATDQGRNPQIANWAALVAYMDSQGGSATYAEIVAALQQAAKDGGYSETDNSANFVRARVRHGHLVGVTAQ